MHNKNISETFLIVEEIQTQLFEIKNYVKILHDTILHNDELYYLQDFIELINEKHCELFGFIDKSLINPAFREQEPK